MLSHESVLFYAASRRVLLVCVAEYGHTIPANSLSTEATTSPSSLLCYCKPVRLLQNEETEGDSASLMPLDGESCL